MAMGNSHDYRHGKVKIVAQKPLAYICNQKVVGPSLVEVTCISAAKIPFSTWQPNSIHC